jgi:hypothetical protein
MNHEYLPTSTTAYEKANEEGLVVMPAGENELQLDIDTDEAYAQFGRVLPVLKEYFGVISNFTTRSKSGDGRHVRIRLAQPMPVMQRIALQAALGSDGVRELLSVVMVLNNDVAPCLLNETPAVAAEVRQWHRELPL